MNNIAFIGKMRYGKTAAANYLVDKYGYEKHSFANPVKDLTCQVLQTTGEFLVDHGNDNGELTLDTNRMQLESYKTHPAIRHLMQVIGGEVGRNFYGPKDIWIQMLLDNLPTSALVVIDDCRYRNEAEALRERGFTLIRVVRDRDMWYKDMSKTYGEDKLFDSMNHASETDLDDLEADFVTEPCSSLRELHANIERIYSNM